MTRCQLMTIVADTQTTGLAVMTKKKRLHSECQDSDYLIVEKNN